VPQTRRTSLIGAASIAVGIALFVWLVWDAGPGEIWAGVRQVGWGLVAVIAIAGLRFGARAAAWIRCLEPPHTLRLSDAFAAVVSGDALGNATPLGPLVGEPAKVAFVRTRVRPVAAFTALAIENVFYTLSVAAVIAAGTTALLVRGTLDSTFVADRLTSLGLQPGVMRMAAEIAIAVILAAYVAAAWILWRRPAVIGRAVALLTRVSASPRLHRRLQQLQRLEDDIYGFAASRRRAAGSLIAIELFFHALGVLEVHVTLWFMFGQAPPLVTSFVLETANRLITVLFKFVPMQQPGVNEAGTVLVAQMLGLTPQTGATLAIVRRARMMFWQLAGTILLVRHGVTTRRILDDAELRRGAMHTAQSHE
jgi:hypothetical protein